MKKDVKAYISENDQLGKLLGVELLEVREGYARGQMRIDERLLNSVGIVHGGAIFTLADVIFAAASNSYGNVAVSVNVTISYMRASREGMLFAESEELSCGKHLSNYTVTVKDEEGRTVAVFHGMAYRMKDELEVDGA